VYRQCGALTFAPLASLPSTLGLFLTGRLLVRALLLLEVTSLAPLSLALLLLG
jgi:hypothetical protein